MNNRTGLLNNSIKLEEGRVGKYTDIDSFPYLHERHRIFPQIFERRDHKRIIDLSAGIGILAKRIREGYKAEIICNEISPTCLVQLEKMGFKTTNFDLDNPDGRYPIENGSIAAAIALATIEHLINIDHFMNEIERILKNGGYLYISAPNYASPNYLIPCILTGRTFHDPNKEESKYEFYAHVRYFTYRSLREYVERWPFRLESVYLARPKGSSKFLRLQKRSKLLAFIFTAVMTVLYHVASPSVASEPVLCFVKDKSAAKRKKVRKRVV